MPLVTAQRRIPILVAPDIGLQDVDGTLTLENPSYVTLDPALFSKSNLSYGKYDVFKLFKFTQLVGLPGYLNLTNLAALGRNSYRFTQEGNYIVLTFT